MTVTAIGAAVVLAIAATPRRVLENAVLIFARFCRILGLIAAFAGAGFMAFAVWKLAYLIVFRW